MHRGDRLRLVDDVAPGGDDHILPANTATQVAHILRGLDQRRAGGAANGATVHDIVAEHLGGYIADDIAAVVDVPRGVDRHGIPRHQRAGGVEVHPGALREIDLGHEH
ncbi:hypothetical protein D3C72_1512190 [compost metagenome]